MREAPLNDCILTPNYLILYSSIPPYNPDPHRPKFNTNKGEISADQCRRIKYATRLMFWSSEKKKGFERKTGKQFTWRLNMITLTLSDQQRHTDKFIRKNLLEPFLRILRWQFGVEKYVWKAEVQLRGALHFHITTDKFLPWKEIQNIWNRIQERHGYLIEYKKANEGKEPNSTDIKAIKNDKQLSNYLGKYISKSEEMEDGENGMIIQMRVSCKLWDCSRKLKMKKCKLESIENITGHELRNAIETGQKFIGDFSTMIIYNVKKFPRLRQHFRNYLIDGGLIEAKLMDRRMMEFE